MPYYVLDVTWMCLVLLVYVQLVPYDAHCKTSTQFYSLVNIQHTNYTTLYLCHDYEAHLQLFF